MAKQRSRIKIDDLDTNAIQDLNEDDVRKITGGATTFGTNPGGADEAARFVGSPAPFVPSSLPKVSRRR